MSSQISEKQKLSFDLSIIIPNLNSPIIDQTIKSLLIQNTQYRYEIIIVGQDKYEIVNHFSSNNVKHIITEKPTPPGISRNFGVKESSGEYLFFIDADCIANPNWIQQHMRVHIQSNECVVVGGGVDFPTDDYLPLVDNVSTFHEYMIHINQQKKEQLPSLNLSMPRKIWNTVGGFDVSFPFPAGEDADLSTRILEKGFSLEFFPGAFIQHRHNRDTLSNLLLHAYRFGKYSVKGNKKFQKILNTPFILKSRLLVFAFSPILAAYIILKMIFLEKLPIKYWTTLPLVYLLKISWCIGFALR